MSAAVAAKPAVQDRRSVFRRSRGVSSLGTATHPDANFAPRPSDAQDADGFAGDAQDAVGFAGDAQDAVGFAADAQDADGFAAARPAGSRGP
jgi:hypothetical protein